MLTSKILNKKKIIDKFATKITDMIYSTFSFPRSSAGSGISAVNEYENMRPDLVANRIYGDQSKWDALLKYNGISNPFSIQQGDLLYSIPFAALNNVYVSPRVISERGQKTETGALLNDSSRGASGKDKRRIENLANKNAQRAKGAAAAKNASVGATIGKDGSLPPNLSKKGDKSVKVKDGRLVFGEDVTTVNKENCPVPISRARLQAALLKDKLFL